MSWLNNYRPFLIQLILLYFQLSALCLTKRQNITLRKYEEIDGQISEGRARRQTRRENIMGDN